MKIKILVSCAGNDFSFRAGESVETSDEIAKDLISAEFAEEVSPQMQTKPKDTSKSEAKAEAATKQKAGAKKDDNA